MAEPGRGRSFGPTVLLGLAAAALTAVSASRDWARASGSAAGVHVSAAARGSSSAPLAVALALVALAAWGTVLVLRGRARRLVAVLGALASTGVLATVVGSSGRARADAVQAVVSRGGAGDAAATSLTGWYVGCAIGAALTLLTFAVAVVAAPGWPAMGARYDAPGARATGGTARTDHTEESGPAEPVAEQDMWRALDDGRDPTA